MKKPGAVAPLRLVSALALAMVATTAVSGCIQNRKVSESGLEAMSGFGDCDDIFSARTAPAVAAVLPGGDGNAQLDALLDGLPPEYVVPLTRAAKVARRSARDDRHRRYMMVGSLSDSFERAEFCEIENRALVMYLFADAISAALYRRGLEPEKLFGAHALASKGEDPLTDVLLALSLRLADRGEAEDVKPAR